MQKILVVGGHGYLGSIITDMLLARNFCVTVYDKCLFNNDYIEGIRKPIKFSKKFDEIIDDNYDLVIWTATIDADYFYDIENFYEEHLMEFNLLNKRFNLINLSPKTFKNNTKSEDFIQKLFYDAKTTRIIPELYGPSPRMRWDTVCNAMIYDLLTENCLIIGERVFDRYSIANVSSIANQLVEMIEFPNMINIDSFEIDGNFSPIELAFIMKDCFKDAEIIVKNLDLSSFDYMIEKKIERKFKPLQESIKNVIQQLERGLFPDFSDERHNNSKIVTKIRDCVEFLNRGIIKCPDHTLQKQK